MMATTLKTQADVSRDKPLWHIDLGDTFVNLKEGGTDEDTVTSAASKETLRGGSFATTQGDLEPHEIGGVLFNPGPPFLIRDIILYDSGCGCDANGRRQLRAFVIKLDHPRYQLRLEAGVTVSTSMQEALLMPRLVTWPGNPNDLAPDQDDPFVNIRRKVEHEGARGKRKLGSYGVHGNAQRESICLVEEAKAYAKAVKSDDAPVLEHLWKDCVKALGIAKETRDKALVGLWNLGLRWFKSALKRDCADCLAS
jgi:hypothetical protein